MNHYSSFKTHLAKVSLTCICFFLVLWSTAQINEDQSTGNVAIGGDVDNNFKLTVDGRMQITGELLSTETHFTGVALVLVICILEPFLFLETDQLTALE